MAAADPQPSPPSRPSNAFDDLHRRTYELELLISGAIVFALLQLPGRIAELFEEMVFHLTGGLEELVTYAFVLVEAILYVLTAAFLLHLAVRAYWIGLIGLRSVFPRGIDWDRLTMVGPIQQRYYQRTLPSLEHLIDRTDRIASSTFAVSAMLVLLLGWSGLMLGAGTLLATAAQGFLGGSARGWGLALFGLAVMAPAVVVSVLDQWVAKRHPEWLARPGVARFGDGAMRLMSLMMPVRILTPVQSTLQSNLDGRRFIAFVFVTSMLLPLVGGAQLVLGRQEAWLNSYAYVDERAVGTGVDTRLYDALRGEGGRRGLPSLDTDVVTAPYVRVFLPHVPDYDNEDLAVVCPDLTPRGQRGVAGLFSGRPMSDAWQAESAACLAKLWEVSFAGVVLPAAELVATRRPGPRFGLTGYLPVSGLAPGRHVVTIRRLDPRETAATARRPHAVRGRTFEIPFWLGR
jgi:hypothetical protein